MGKGRSKTFRNMEKKWNMIKIDLSIIIVTYKSEKLIIKCLDSIYESDFDTNFEVIISDNSPNSATETVIKKALSKYPNLTFIKNKKNEGFSRGNNIAIKKATGEFVLFLNPDMVLEKDTLGGMLEFVKSKNNIGAATCKVNLLDGSLDDSCHRGFPTPWAAFFHFTKISKLFPKIKVFSGYNMTYLDFSKTHEIDSLAGSFMIMPFSVGRDLNWWDEDFFFYGEDIDFCYRIKQKGLSIYFVPKYKALHYKGASSGIKKISKDLSTANKQTIRWATRQRFKAMEIFYDKHYKKKYPAFVRSLVLFGIKLKYNITKVTNGLN